MDTTAGSFHLSPQQEDLWAREPEGPQARIQAALILEGPLDPEAVRVALRRLVGRHEILRTTFVFQPGLRLPLQAIAEHVEPALTVVAPGAERRDELLGAELERDFDLGSGPLMRALLLSDGSARHELVLTISALCADAASVALALDEVRAACADGVAPVDDPLQYADFAAWQRELLESPEDEGRSAAQRWSELVPASYPELPFARAARTRAAEQLSVALSPDTAAAISRAAQRYGIAPAAFVQAGWHALLARYGAQATATVAYLSGERRHDDLQGAIGAFSRPVPLTVAVTEQTSFAEVLHAIGRGREEALTLQDYAPVGALGRPECAFVELQGCPGGPHSLALAGLASLWLACVSGDDGLALSVGYDPGAHAGALPAQLAGALGELLEAAAAQTATPVAHLPVLDSRQAAQLIDDFAGPVLPRPAVSVTALIRQHAGEGVAVIDERGELTHAQLHARGAQLAHELAHRGVRPGDRVGICTDRSADMVIGVLGILMAGGAYVPLHPEHPPARLAAQLRGAGASAIVTQEPLRDRLSGATIVCLDSDREALDAHPATAPEVEVVPGDLAYVIYTSGSTGTPKGVAVTHRNLVNYALHLIERLGAGGAPMRFAMVSSLATDLGNTSLFGALCSGATLVLPSSGDPGAIGALCARAGVDVLKITPSHLSALLAGGDARILPSRWLILGGERAAWDVIETVRRLGSPQILNHYGPTETTVGCCMYPVPDQPGPWGCASVPIGAPIANTVAYVLDAERSLTPIGVAGRLFIGGDGVAAGYVGDDEQTAARFIADPIRRGQRVYDTGDLARWLPDGTLEFLGRADDQLKIRGYRVEPGEVESALRAHPAVGEAVVVPDAPEGGQPRLLAYCAATGAGVDELREHLAARLPDYMVPSAITVLERLPRTPSGKVDRQALPAPDSASAAAAEHLAPRTPMEQAVAAIWAQVLGLAQVGVADDFFALGGHSLLATQVVAQVRSDFAVDLPLHSLFTHPTVAQLTAEIVSMMGAADDDTARLLAELDGMSDEEAERMLRGDRS